ncbi:MAG: septum formation protein Maf [Clostridia bacterium]|nr:septum formation protein Maf [Clostridia bacterium]
MMRIVLASKSPRRREILSMLGINFEVITADTDESSTIKDPAALVEELAIRKGRAVKALLQAQGEWNENTLIIASDTVVATGNDILGKPEGEEDAARMLRLLSDSTHHVISGIALLLGKREITDHDKTAVHFAKMTEADILWYAKSGEPLDKAGAYAVQGLASLFIKGLTGDYFNVVGLPVYRLNLLVKQFTEKSLTEL